jgi:hypothetical protein
VVAVEVGSTAVEVTVVEDEAFLATVGGTADTSASHAHNMNRVKHITARGYLFIIDLSPYALLSRPLKLAWVPTLHWLNGIIPDRWLGAKESIN